MDSSKVQFPYFFPGFSHEDRQKFTEIEMGQSLDIHFYDSLHNIETANQSCPSEERVDDADSEITDGVGEVETPILNEDSADTDSFTETATEDLSKLFESLKEKIDERINNITPVY